MFFDSFQEFIDTLMSLGLVNFNSDKEVQPYKAWNSITFGKLADVKEVQSLKMVPSKLVRFCRVTELNEVHPWKA